ncbi:MAG: hypothetical protein AB7K52_11530 [Phycisphaerales bacterium]
MGILASLRRSMLALAALGSFAAAGCGGYTRDANTVALTAQGQFGQAREAAMARASRKPDDRSYMLDRAKILALSLADGVPEAAEPVADRMYDFLRSQGVNADKDVASFFFDQGSVRIWKGEPFEQAMSLTYIGILDGSRGSWGNLRASVNNALFQVRDLSRAIAAAESSGQVKTSGSADAEDREKVIAAASLAEKEPGRDGSIEQFVTPQPSDFELAYILKLIASRRLGTGEEEEIEAQLTRVAPRLSELARFARSGDYNLVLVVDYGMAPEKYRTGTDGAIAAFRPTTQSTTQGLVARVEGRASSFPIVTDLNRLAQDLRWNNLEDMRRAKSAIGTAMIIGGATAAAVSNDSTTQLVGLGVLLAGLAMKASAGADVRHIEVFPQRSYVALLKLDDPLNTIELMIDGSAETRMLLASVPRPPDGELMLRYVRLPMNPGPWATSGRVFYDNDASPADVPGAGSPADAGNFPWILGGRCVRTPSEEVLASYQRSGYLTGMNLSDLIALYREEGIRIAGYAGPEEGEIGRHILEGGTWLYTPQAGTAGFARLYGIQHPPYTPKSSLAASLRGGRSAGPVAAASGGSR